MNKMIKVINIFIIVTMLLISMSNIIYAAATNPFASPEKWKPTEGADADFSNYVKDRAGVVLGVVRNVGVIISVIALSIIGLKYMLGSIEEKAKYKETLKPFLIGAIILAAGTTLVDYIYQIATKF